MNIFKFAAVCSGAMLIAFAATAKQHETFADNPTKREQRVKTLREQAQQDRENARRWAKKHGVKMRQVHGSRIVELVAVRNGRPFFYTTLNDDAAITTAADQVRQTIPYNVNGSHVTVGVWDVGSAQSTHPEFGSRVSVMDGASVSEHATHVCGTIGAAGVVPQAKGMAPAAYIHCYDWTNDVSEMASVAAAAAGESNKITLSNQSYGSLAGWVEGEDSLGIYWVWFGDWNVNATDELFGQYMSYAADLDGMVYDAPYHLPFRAAGNDRNDNPANGDDVYDYNGSAWYTYDSTKHPQGDGVFKGGYDTVLPDSTAKNIMTVGAVGKAVDNAQRSLSSAAMSEFSGWGPCDDGRIKPDIVADGVGVYSTVPTNGYASASGTSMASPNACGSAALLVDYYGQCFPGQAMRASTLKGLIIQTADDLGNSGPDYSYGWGLMNTRAAADLIKDYADGNTKRMTEAVLNNSDHRSDTYWIMSGGTEPVRVTLCWTDPPGASHSDLDNRTPNLVNDLDLKVTGPGGTYYPYKLDYANPSDNATATGKNDIDNVEQVYIATPGPGEYIITVDYDGTLTDGEQYYSLLVSGTDSDTDGDGMTDYWELTYFGSITGGVASADNDLDGANNLWEFVSGCNPMNASSVLRPIAFYPSAPNGSDYVIRWNPVEGRVYGIEWTDNLADTPFSSISGDLPYPANSYTDTVIRVGLQQFYRIDVR